MAPLHKRQSKAKSHSRLFWFWMAACTGMLAFLQPARAADNTTAPKTEAVTKPAPVALPYTYAPGNCEFRVDLPGTPLQGKRCDPDDASHCSDVTTYTHVFALDATVNFTFTCNQAEPNMYERYSGAVMRATLDGMVGKGKLDNYQTGFKQYDAAKQATIIGTGKEGMSDKIYIAQLWIGHQSVFTVEGELVGQENSNADDLFAAILKSIRHKSWKLTPAGPVPGKGTDAAATQPAPAATTATATAAGAPATAAPAPAPATPSAPEAAAPAPATVAPAVDNSPIPAIKMDANMLPPGSAPADFAPPSRTLIVTPQMPAQQQPPAQQGPSSQP